METKQTCQHLAQFDFSKLINKSEYIRFECEECMKIKSWWVHLRICQDCGAMLCCDSLPNQHARRHFETKDHKVIASADLGENWLYCYTDDATLNF